MLKTRTAIRQSAHDTSHLTTGWTDTEARCEWPEDFCLRGGKYRTGDYFVFASSTNSNRIEDIAEADVFYGTGNTLEVAEESAYTRFLQNRTV